MVLGGEGRPIHEGEIQPVQVEQKDLVVTPEITNAATEQLLHLGKSEPAKQTGENIIAPPIQAVKESDHAEITATSINEPGEDNKLDKLTDPDDIQAYMANQFEINSRDQAA